MPKWDTIGFHPIAMYATEGGLELDVQMGRKLEKPGSWPNHLANAGSLLSSVHDS